MNKKMPKGQIIVLVLLVVVAGFFIYRALLSSGETPPPAAATKPAAQQPAAGPNAGTPAAVPDATKAATAPAANAASAFKQSNVNIDELLASIKEVDFDYALERETRDPMTPLVGKHALTQYMAAENGGAANALNSGEAQRLAMNMTVTGIVWDKKSPMAVVNNEVVYPGYVFDSGIAVESIEPTRVLLRVGDSVIPKELEER